MSRFSAASVVPVAITVAVMAAWEAAVAAYRVPEFILPPPTVIGATLVEIIPILAPHVLATLWEILLGFTAGVIGGAVLAVLMVLVPRLQVALYPIVLATQTTPKIAIAPLLIVWLGVGLEPKVVIVALLAFFPVLINTVTGLQGADGQQLELMRSVNASRWQEYRQIRFPTAIPFFFAGLKLALSVSVIGAIVAEWVSATEGLGYLLVYYNATLDTAKLFAVLVVLVILASALFAVLGLAERLLSWESRLKQATGRGVVVDTRRQAEAAL